MKPSHLGTLAVFIACALPAGCSSASTPATTPPPVTENPATPPTAFQVQDSLRGTWTSHATDMHMYLIEALAALPDADRALDHQLQNQDYLGATIAPFWGQDLADRLTGLLRDRALIAGDLLTAMKANDVPKIESVTTRWYDNGDQTVALFFEADPTIPVDVKGLVRLQMDALYAQIRARVDKQWADDIAAQDLFVTHTNNLADILSWSVRTRYPDKVATPAVDPVIDETHRENYSLWRDQSFWTRAAIVEQIAGLPSSYAATNRIIRHEVTMGDVVKPYYTPAEGSRLTTLLAKQMLAVIEYVDTSRGNDPAKTANVKFRLYAGANDIAALYAQNNPKSSANWANLWKRNVDHTLNQITARQTGDWNNDIAAYEESVNNDRNLAQAIADGMLNR